MLEIKSAHRPSSQELALRKSSHFSLNPKILIGELPQPPPSAPPEIPGGVSPLLKGPKAPDGPAGSQSCTSVGRKATGSSVSDGPPRTIILNSVPQAKHSTTTSPCPFASNAAAAAAALAAPETVDTPMDEPPRDGFTTSCGAPVESVETPPVDTWHAINSV